MVGEEVGQPRSTDDSDLKVEDARVLTSGRIEQLPEFLARRWREH